jgi:alcohol dehydrogenase YqhD (iron-dependent ADH family)
MNDFTFQNSTKVYFGRNQLTHLGEEIRKCGSRVLLVYGALKDFLYQKLELRSTLTEVGIDDKRFSEMAEKACGKNGVIRGYRDLTPSDVETIYRMCL